MRRVLKYMLLPLEVRLLILNLSVETPDPVHWINTVLGSTPSIVLTVQLTTSGSPTIAPCTGPDCDMVIVGMGTVHRNKSVGKIDLIIHTYKTHQLHLM